MVQSNAKVLSMLIAIIILLVQVDVQYFGAEATQGWGWGPNPGANITKPGECPAPDSSMDCSDKLTCNSDCECPQQQKCCSQPSCGKICQTPTVIVDYGPTCGEDREPGVKPGTCPEPEEGIYCIWCYDQCKSDCECPGKEICCPTFGCGNACTNATRI